MKKYLAITLLIGMVCAMSVAFAGESYWTVGYPDLFLRSTPSTEYPYLDRMPYGSEVVMISDGADWALVYYNGQYGYCKREYLNDYDPYYMMEPHPDTPEAAFGTNLLQRGNKKPSYKVNNLQLCLVEGGYLDDDPGVDGYFGRETREALKSFQLDHDISSTGKAGDIIAAVLPIVDQLGIIHVRKHETRKSPCKTSLAAAIPKGMDVLQGQMYCSMFS